MKKHNYTIVRQISLAILLILALLTSSQKAVKETGFLKFLDGYPQLHCIIGGCGGAASSVTVVHGIVGVQHFAKQLGFIHQIFRPSKGAQACFYFASFCYHYDLTNRDIKNRNEQLIPKIIARGAMIGLSSFGVLLL